MNTKEKKRTGQQRDMEYEALTCALAILVERIHSLPQADKDDLYELMKDLPKTESEEDLDNIMEAVREIMDQRPIRLQRMEQGSEFRPGKGLQRWIDFISAKIKTLREEAGLTQMELAEKSGLPQSHVSRLENGLHSPSHATVKRLAKALNVAVSELDPSA